MIRLEFKQGDTTVVVERLPVEPKEGDELAWAKALGAWERQCARVTPVQLRPPTLPPLFPSLHSQTRTRDWRDAPKTEFEKIAEGLRRL